MLSVRVIPCLLLKGQGLVKTIRFKEPKYVGDPINAVKIFNEKEVDELVFLDITPAGERERPHFQLISQLVDECFMPLGYGGGIRKMEDIESLFTLGIEKIIINTASVEDPSLVTGAARAFGSQSIVISIDVKKNLFERYEVHTHNGTVNTGLDPVRLAREMEDLGGGEILLNAIDHDGTMEGYDIELIRSVSHAVNIPVIACGGAGSIEDFARAIGEGGASAVAAGSMFVFHGRHRAVLITYPEPDELKRLFAREGRLS